MKNAGIEYRLILVLMGISAIGGILTIWKPELFPDYAKPLFRAFLFIGFVWYFTRGKKMNPNG
jgi:type IV secretory pathway TrbL component